MNTFTLDEIAWLDRTTFFSETEVALKAKLAARYPDDFQYAAYQASLLSELFAKRGTMVLWQQLILRRDKDSKAASEEEKAVAELLSERVAALRKIQQKKDETAQSTKGDQ